MLFSTGILLAGGGILGVALLDSLADSLGFLWLGNFVKVILPIVGFALAIYFLETNAIIGWLR
ncbi:hypothetical protein ACFSO7_20565 [Bacillus sp. CGMCC 1.16607]|uniref:hypothetical protein n=1 Tax=Bacillus sp. CGMCC 1.16607 TaxID=3351842 RepID=UPI00363AAE85